VRLKEVQFSALQGLAHVGGEVEDGQVLADETPDRDPRFTREQVAKLRVNPQQFFAAVARGPAALSLLGLTHVEAAYGVEE
jgi:hypothetical protein